MYFRSAESMGKLDAKRRAIFEIEIDFPSQLNRSSASSPNEVKNSFRYQTRINSQQEQWESPDECYLFSPHGTRYYGKIGPFQKCPRKRHKNEIQQERDVSCLKNRIKIQLRFRKTRPRMPETERMTWKDHKLKKWYVTVHTSNRFFGGIGARMADRLAAAA